jgi:hypothetical protein
MVPPGELAARWLARLSRDGVRVFLAGRTVAKVQQVADEIAATGGVAQAAVDALDRAAIERHLDAVIARAGGQCDDRRHRQSDLWLGHGLGPTSKLASWWSWASAGSSSCIPAAGRVI